MKKNNQIQVVMCGLVNKTHLNKEIIVKGWIKKNRKLGGLIFIDLADISGVVQIIVNQNSPLYNQCLKLSKESVVCMSGVVKIRSNINKNLKTGEFEIHLKDLKVYANAALPPFLIQDETDGLEELRLKYRYLDLRRPIMQQYMINRAKIINLFRSFLIKQDFIEVETPYLSKQTPEGARDYLVPTRNQKFFALPQSPQIYKQLLMISGFNKYFQIARCFRDEDLRADRQPEFSQIDIETSFLDQKQIQKIVEDMFTYVFLNYFNFKLKTPFFCLDYEDAINKYGSDKPDLRFENEILALTPFLLNNNHPFFVSSFKNNKHVYGLFIEEEFSKEIIKSLTKLANDNKVKDLFNITIKNKAIIEENKKQIIDKNTINQICSHFNLNSGTLLFVVEKKEIALNCLGAIRNYLPNVAKSLKMKSDYSFVWIVNWPLFEFSETENRFVSAHHPFTSPSYEWINNFDLDPKNAKALAYDLVLNGYEIGGGSIRIFDINLQNKMFAFLGLSKKEIETKFGFFIKALTYGVPPHGGIAFGIERILMLMLKTNNIRDVIAFPKNSAGIDLLFETPSNPSIESLKELKLKIEK